MLPRGSHGRRRAHKERSAASAKSAQSLFHLLGLGSHTALQRQQGPRGPFAPPRVVHVLTQLCGGLAEAHARGLVHRDAKPANVMLCERGGRHDVAKLLDFGLAAGLRPEPVDPKLSHDRMVISTPAFMSPEQCRVDASVTPASDIYSLGALGYFLVTGKEPFTGSSAMQVMLAHLHEHVRPVRELRPDAPPVLASVVERCLAKDPFERFASAAMLHEALSRAGKSEV